MGVVGTLTSLVGNFLTPELGVKPEGKEDTIWNRRRYTKYGAFTKRRTLYGCVICLAVGLTMTMFLVVTGNWNLD